MQNVAECQNEETSLICPKLEEGCFLATTEANWLYFNMINAPLLVSNFLNLKGLIAPANKPLQTLPQKLDFLIPTDLHSEF